MSSAAPDPAGEKDRKQTPDPATTAHAADATPVPVTDGDAIVEQLDTPPRRGRTWVVVLAAAIAAVLLICALLAAGLGGRSKTSGPTGSPALTTVSPQASASTPPVTQKVSDKAVADIAWPQEVAGEQRASAEPVHEGPVATRATYEGPTKATAALQRDLSTTVAAASLREVHSTDALRCGRQTSTAVCFGDVADGILVVHATDPATTPEQLAAFAEALAKRLN